MRENTRRCHAVVLLSLLLVAAVLGACGNSNKKSTSPATAPGPAVQTGMNACVTCHTAIVADWITSKHANAEGGDLSSPGNPTSAQVAADATCAACHDPLGDSQRLTPGLTGVAGTTRPVIGCESCHGGGSLHVAGGGTGPISLLSDTAGTSLGSVAVSGQFVMCTSCHELLNSSGTVTVATHDPSGSVTPTGAQYVITDTHFATAITTFGTTTITGYAMDFSSETICTDCHNPHKSADINKEWAMSAHAITAPSGAWARINWSTRPTCQRCKTTTGYAAYASALGSGNIQSAQSILYGTLATSPVPSASSWKPEMLECRGCHTDNKGTVRNPGAYTADYSYNYVSSPYTIYSVASHAYPDLGASNVCMPCHTALWNGDSIKNMNSGSVAAISFANRSMVSTHNFQAGAVMFRAGGYNYDGRDYTNPSFYMHDKIGTSSAPNTGTNGPCVGCHMSRPNGVGNHLFLPATKDETETTITNIASEVCYQCHGPNDSAFVNMVNDQKGLFVDAQSALQYLIELRGYYERSSSYYKLRDKTGTAIVTNGSFTVSGSGLSTFWTTTATSSGTTVTPGDYFRVDSDGNYYKIKSVVDDTTLTLDTTALSSGVTTSLYSGATASAVNYTIIGGATSDRITDWLTKAGSGFVPATADDTDTTGNTTGKNNMGAAFNLNLLSVESSEPGAYVHNRYYAKRLLYDSIDWLDDNQMNYSVGATLTAVCSGTSAPAWCAGAQEYLLPNGVLGIPAERP